MEKYQKHVAWSEEDQAWIARSPEFPDLSAAGETESAALDELREVIAAAIETYTQEGWKLPEPRTIQPEFSGQLRLRLPKHLHALAADRADVEGVSLNGLLQAYVAKGLGVSIAESGARGTLDALVAEILELLKHFATTSVTAAEQWSSATHLRGPVRHGRPPAAKRRFALPPEWSTSGTGGHLSVGGMDTFDHEPKLVFGSPDEGVVILTSEELK